jgi:hypothetical protein
VARLRELDLVKQPGVAETLSWARALSFLGVDAPDRAAAEDTLGAVIKDRDDLARVRDALDRVLGDE